MEEKEFALFLTERIFGARSEEDAEELAGWLMECPHGYRFAESDGIMGGALHVECASYLELISGDEEAAKIAAEDGAVLISPSQLPRYLDEWDKYDAYLDTPDNREIIRKHIVEQYGVEWGEPDVVVPDMGWITNARCNGCGSESLWINSSGFLICPRCGKIDLMDASADGMLKIFLPCLDKDNENKIIRYALRAQEIGGCERGNFSYDIVGGKNVFSVGFACGDDMPEFNAILPFLQQTARLVGKEERS